jgi:alpha-beta hydrolase superfamily lysophospholipase
MKAMGFSNLESRVWPETRHESLNELNRNAITESFAAWAEGIAPG